MRITLSQYGIKEAIQNLDNLKANIVDANYEIVNTLVSKADAYANGLNASAPQSGLEKSQIVSRTTENGNAGYVALVGENAVYDEFGTGDMGQDNPHPLKGQFGLNPYNSGPHIFYNQLANRNQWRYTRMAGQPYFTDDGLTSGIPAGKVIYDTSVYVRDIKDDIIKKTLDNATSRYRK